MAVAFGLVAFAAREEHRRGRSPFAGLYLRDTIPPARPPVREGDRQRPRGRPGAASRPERRGGATRRARGQRDPAARGSLPPLPLSAGDREGLKADPAAGVLGGETRDVSVLFADLQGFTSFSEGCAGPGEVVEMLNEYWAHAVPAVAEEGGMVERFAGDAVMVVFNAAEDQADHAARAARAGLGLQKAAAKLGERHPDWPVSASVSTPAWPWSGTSAAPSTAASPRSATPRTSPRGCRPLQGLARS